ncbi:hypothetical protein BFP70_01890 [Thioclava sp. SK-1]|nr:hypothetical protein BFP70_01890 [Thioclava sp. SK-1]
MRHQPVIPILDAIRFAHVLYDLLHLPLAKWFSRILGKNVVPASGKPREICLQPCRAIDLYFHVGFLLDDQHVLAVEVIPLHRNAIAKPLPRTNCKLIDGVSDRQAVLFAVPFIGFQFGHRPRLVGAPLNRRGFTGDL